MNASPGRQETSRDADRWIGRVIASRYRLVERLGAGTGGRVFRAVSLESGADVALKVVEAQADPDDGEEAFLGRGATAMRLDHPGIARMLDFGFDEDGVRYVVMERVEGQALDAVLRAKKRFDAPSTVEIALQLAAALRHVHAAGLVHRDLKPSNVLLSRAPDGAARVTLLDFGIATSPGAGGAAGMQGSPAYAAPGQASGEAADPRDDVYGLGVIVYELATGRLPFDGGSSIDVVLRHLREAPKPPRMVVGTIPPRLEAAILRALEKERGARFQSMDEWIAALESIRDELARDEPPDRSVAEWMNDAWSRFARLVGF
ncbi:MAG TPA: serine/threonine-protein kinase [Vulgatibacter sp.]|nr:serine/threonine-protein kinase [Vulgatibacter sp.]